MLQEVLRLKDVRAEEILDASMMIVQKLYLVSPE